MAVSINTGKLNACVLATLQQNTVDYSRQIENGRLNRKYVCGFYAENTDVLMTLNSIFRSSLMALRVARNEDAYIIPPIIQQQTDHSVTTYINLIETLVNHSKDLVAVRVVAGIFFLRYFPIHSGIIA